MNAGGTGVHMATYEAPGHTRLLASSSSFSRSCVGRPMRNEWSTESPFDGVPGQGGSGRTQG